MRIIPKRVYRAIMIGLLPLLLALTLSLVVATAVVGLKPNLQVKNGLGTYDAKNKIFYPEFDDLKVQEIYKNKYTDGNELGLKYSDIFKDADKSLSKYSFGGEGLGSSNILKLKSTETKITLQRKIKRTFSKKKKDFTITVNWKNVMFVKDGEREVTSLLKSTLEKGDSFSDLERAYNFRYSTLSEVEKGANPKIEFSNYHVAAIKDGGGYKSILRNKNKTDFNLAEDSKRKESIDQASHLELISNTATQAPYPVLTFQVRNDRKTLIKTELKDEETYRVENLGVSDYEKLGYSDSLLNPADYDTCTDVSEGQDIPLNKPLYIYAFLKNTKRLISTDIKYEFEIADQNDKYESPELAKLQKSIVTHNSEKGENISVTNFDVYSADRDKRLKLQNQAEFDANSNKYDKQPEIFYTSDRTTSETSTDGNIVDDGSANYKVIFRYKRKRVLVRFMMPEGSNPATIAEQTVMFGSKLKPISTDITYRQSTWNANTTATLKYFSETAVDYSINYAQDATKFDITNHVFDKDEDFAQPIKTLHPIWNKAEHVPVMLKLFGQQTSGGEYDQGVVGGSFEYQANINKKDGDKVKVSEVLEFVKQQIDDNIYNKNDITFKFNGSEIGQNDDINVMLPRISVEFFVKRKVRSIILNTSETVDATNVKGAFEISSDKKRLKFRHGYQFVGDESPTIPSPTNARFKGWQRNNVLYEFVAPNKVEEDITLVAKLLAKVDVKLKLYGQDTSGEGYTNIANWTSNITKYEGDKVRVSEVLDFVKSNIDETAYNKDSVTFKHNGSLINANDDINVALPSVDIVFYVNRNLRTITLNTPKSVNVSAVTGAVEITNGNKTLKFRHGYVFGNNASPYIPDDNEEEFLGWKIGTSDFDFNNYTVTQDITLTPNLKKRNARITMYLNGMQANGLRYVDGAITGIPDSTNTTITLTIPYNKLPYTLKELTTDSGAVVYNKNTQRQIHPNGYTGATTINTVGDNYSVTVAYTEATYANMYPQTEASVPETVETEEVANNTPKAELGTFSYTLAYSKGIKYEVLGGKYYKFEVVKWESFPSNLNQQWTRDTIDFSLFDKDGAGATNQYSSSYVKGYIDIMANKMKVSGLALPKLGGAEVLSYNDATAYADDPAEKAALQYKKITDYATAIHSNYSKYRKPIGYITCDSNTFDKTWLGTHFVNETEYSCVINRDGSIFQSGLHNVCGLRVAK